MLPTLLTKGNLVVDGKVRADVTPIDFVVEAVEKRVSKKGIENKVLIIHASTGSGKSTIIPPELYKRLNARPETRNRSVVCTQPRVMTAEEVPRDIVTYNKDLKMGLNIGFQTGTKSLRPKRGIVFMTSGVLMNQLSTMTDEEFADTYSVVILDEVHDRSTSADYVLYAMKSFLQRNADKANCPVLLLMSATIDAEKMGRYYFGRWDSSTKANLVTVKGFSFEITDHFLDVATSDLEGDIQKLVGSFDEDVLVFLPGTQEMRDLEALLLKNNDKKRPYVTVTLTSESVKRGEAKIAGEMKDLRVDIDGTSYVPRYRVFLATNVAETGLTIPSLRHVIDVGLLKSSEYNPYLDCGLLVTRPVTKFMHMQRRGRVGRRAPGDAWFMYTRKMYEAMDDDVYPDLIRSEVTVEVLSILLKEHGLTAGVVPENEPFRTGVEGNKARGDKPGDAGKGPSNEVIDLFEVDLPDRLSTISVHASLDKLYTLGMIDRDCAPTKTGVLACKFRFISVEGMKAVLSAFAWDACVLDVVSMVAAVKFDVQDRGRKEEYAAYVSSMPTLRLSCDFMTKLYVFLQFADAAGRLSTDGLRGWCNERGLSYDALMDVLYVRSTMIEAVYDMGLDVKKNSDRSLEYELDMEEIKKLKRCLFEGYKNNVLLFVGGEQGGYVTRKSHKRADVPAWLAGSRVKYALYDGLFCRPKRGMYKFSVNMASALDGFLPFDNTFDAL